MATFDDIPLEVQEQIFLHLKPRDLKECSFVCSKWNDIINSNQIWLKMCAIEGLAGKKFLDDSYSLMMNPTKQFSNEVTLSPLCHWKSHFNRYKYVKRNWRVGYFVRSPIRFTPIHMNEQFVVQLLDTEFVIWDVCGALKKFCSVPLQFPDCKIDGFVWNGDFICYIQQRHVICLKRGENSCKEILNIKLPPGGCTQIRNNCLKQNMTVRLTNKFLLIQDHMTPCVIYLYDCHKGRLVRTLELHKVLGSHGILSILFNCCEMIDEKLFVTYRIGDNPFIVKYNYGLDNWETALPLQNEAVELYVSKRFVCVKLSPESRDSPISALQVWDHTVAMQPMEEVSEFYASKHLPIVLTDNDHVIYHTRDEIKIHDLLNDYVQMFSVTRGVMKFAPIWEKYLVILDEKGVSVWDWERGKKITTPFRDDCCSTFYVSETNIVIRRDDAKFYIISYW